MFPVPQLVDRFFQRHPCIGCRPLASKPDGYAYRKTGSDISLDGRLISSKMIISPDGKFIGSIVPGGQITDFDGKAIGFIHANGLAYDENAKIIGRLVRSGYAFDDYGNYYVIKVYNVFYEKRKC